MTETCFLPSWTPGPLSKTWEYSCPWRLAGGGYFLLLPQQFQDLFQSRELLPWSSLLLHELHFFFSGFVQYLMSFLISCCRIEVCTTTVLPLLLLLPSSSSLVLFVGQEYWRRITLTKRRHDIYQEPFFIAS